MTTEITNADEAAELALSISSDLFARAGYDRLNPFTDSRETAMFLRNLRAELDSQEHAARMIDDDSLNARGARNVVEDNREAIKGWEWACENYDNWQAFSEAAQEIQTQYANAAG